jgi:protein TonB
MKTKNETIATTMAVSLEDIIFSNRNQAYGAYKLRKSYNNHLLIALLFTTFILTTGVGIPYLKYLFFPDKIITVPPIILGPTTFEPEKQVVVPPPPPPKNPTNEALKPAQNSPYVPVDTVQNDEAKDISLASDEPTSLNNEPPIVDFIPKPETDDGFGFDTTPGLVNVEESARFEGGGVETFRDWVQKNVTYPISALEAGIQGKVFMHFAINSKGKMCDVSISRGIHPSIDNETIRIFLNSPDWEPARQNGKVVKQQFTIPIAFSLR